MEFASTMNWAKRALVALIVLVGMVHLGFRLQLVSDHRVDLGGAEMNVVYGVQKILLGRPLYEDPEKPPFDVMQYTPAYYGVCAGVGKALAIDPHDTRALFHLSRIVSLLFNLIACLCVFRLCRALGSDAWLAMAVAAITFTLYTEHFYSRIDSLYALLLAGTLVTYVRWLEQPDQRRSLVITSLLAVLCLAAKQTGVLVIGIIGAHLLATRRWRALLTYGGALLLFTCIAALLVFISTTPTIFLKNTVLGIANGMNGTMYIELLHPPIYKYYVGWHIAGALLVVLFFRSGDVLDRFLAIAISGAFAFGFIAGLKHGSNINYLFEAHLFILLGIARWCCTCATRWQLHLSGLFMLYGLLFTVYRTRLLHTRVGTEEERAVTEAAYRADLHVRDVLVNDLGLRAEDKVFITYRGHLELLLNGQGLLAQKDILEWSVKPLFHYSAFEEVMGDQSVRFVISDAPMDTLFCAGVAWTLPPPMREVEGRYIVALSPR